MEGDLGKLFIGGISWDTNEIRLKEYFKNYGEVVEAVIMKDRTTGRARGFGFVVFADPSVAEKVVSEKHIIDGRTVEAKKAVPRDDQHLLNRNNSSNNNVHGSPGPTRTKKIFVGGLASTVTESDFKRYFDQFGTITDVVVMYDHNTQRPRGFGFITYDSEDAVEKVLLQTFHELNGKFVEVKRAVPKELSPGPNRSPISGNFGLNRSHSFLNGYNLGLNMSPIGTYSTRLEKFNPMVNNRSTIHPFGPSSFGMGMGFETGLSSSLSGGTNYGTNINYARGVNALYGGNSGRFNNNLSYVGGNGGTFLNAASRNVWGNEELNYTANSSSSVGYMASGVGNVGGFGNTNTTNWNPISGPVRASAASYSSGNLNYGNNGDIYELGGSGHVLGRNSGSGVNPISFAVSPPVYDGSYADLYNNNSIYGDSTWRSGSSELEVSNSFSYSLGNAATDTDKRSQDFVGGYNVANRQTDRGIAA